GVHALGLHERAVGGVRWGGPGPPVPACTRGTPARGDSRVRDPSRAPILDAMLEFRRRGDIVYTPPGHKQGRGADPRVIVVLGLEAFLSDVLTTGGLDDRTSSKGLLQQAQELMADAVNADTAFFATAGSSPSAQPAMLSVAP